jgi:hypothetical protein
MVNGGLVGAEPEDRGSDFVDRAESADRLLGNERVTSLVLVVDERLIISVSMMSAAHPVTR